MKREVCILVNHKGQVIWEDTDGNAGYLEDHRYRWDAIWETRHELAVIAHSHPCGPLGFSSTDLTTADAVSRGLGPVEIHFAVVAPDGVALLRRGRGWEGSGPIVLPPALEPFWAEELRARSGMAPALAVTDAWQMFRQLTDVRDDLDALCIQVGHALAREPK